MISISSWDGHAPTKIRMCGAPMAHIVIEYSAGLRERLALPAFLSAVHQAAFATGVFPMGGLRTRAYEARDYIIADGHPNNNFVHLSLKVGHGRDVETRKRACQDIFDAATTATRLSPTAMMRRGAKRGREDSKSAPLLP